MISGHTIYNQRFLKFRFRQIGKFLKEIPFPYLIILGGMVGLLLYFCSLWAVQAKGGWIITGSTLFILFLRHIQRKDHSFLTLIEEKPVRIYCMDYLLLSFPIAMILLFRMQWVPFIALQAGMIGISLLPPPRKKREKGIPVPSFIPTTAFEVRSGFRQYGIYLLFLYIAACAGLFIPYLPLFFLWMYTGCYSQFYLQGEGRPLVVTPEKNSREFLHFKLGLHLKIYILSLLPIYTAYILLYPEQVWIILYFLLAGMLNITLLILIKYTFYQPGETIRSGQVAIGFSFLGMILPPILLVTLFYLIKYYRNACKNLNNYLYAYD